MAVKLFLCTTWGTWHDVPGVHFQEPLYQQWGNLTPECKICDQLTNTCLSCGNKNLDYYVRTHSFYTSWQLLMLIDHFLNRIWRQGDHLLRFHAWDHMSSEKRPRKKKSTWCRVNRLPKMGPQFDREEAVHGNQGHLSCLVKIFPKTSAHIHSSGKTKGRFADVFREDRDDGNPGIDGTLSKSLPVNLWMFNLMRRKKSPWSPKYGVVGVSEVCLSCSSWSNSQQRPISREAQWG